MTKPKNEVKNIILQKGSYTTQIYQHIVRKRAVTIPELEVVFEDSSLKQHILAKNIVIDGELALLRDKKITDSSQVVKSKLDDNEQLCYFAFDILEIDGENFMQYPLLSRKQNLGFVIEETNSLVNVPYSATNATEDVMEYYKRLILKGFEGIVLKNCNPYIPDSRFNWLKLKPLRTLDLKIVDRKARKDNKGWRYSISDNGIIVGTIMSVKDFPMDSIVEVGYDKKFVKGDSYRLRFPKILRIREDK